MCFSWFLLMVNATTLSITFPHSFHLQQYVFSASELPPYFPIPQHLEMSFLPSPPRKIFFCCLDPPTSPGGETCLCDFKKVHDQMDPKIRKEFEDKGVSGHVMLYHTDIAIQSREHLLYHIRETKYNTLSMFAPFDESM